MKRQYCSRINHETKHVLTLEYPVYYFGAISNIKFIDSSKYFDTNLIIFYSKLFIRSTGANISLLIIKRVINNAVYRKKQRPIVTKKRT